MFNFQDKMYQYPDMLLLELLVTGQEEEYQVASCSYGGTCPAQPAQIEQKNSPHFAILYLVRLKQ